MGQSSFDQSGFLKHIGSLFKSHPWHGVHIGSEAPSVVTAYIEIVPTDTVKYETDKISGILRIDRPQRYSNVCPTLYGFVPQTYCSDAVARISIDALGRPQIVGDGDPLDICVLTERPISQGDVLLQAIPIGGLRMIDKGEADDKIIAVLQGDPAFGGLTEISECPAALIDRLTHYFLTYKQAPHEETKRCEITHVYGAEEARRVIEASRQDYAASFPELKEAFMTMLAVQRRGSEA
jgi:inorganic pyrophosphatase